MKVQIEIPRVKEIQEAYAAWQYEENIDRGYDQKLANDAFDRFCNVVTGYGLTVNEGKTVGEVSSANWQMLLSAEKLGVKCLPFEV